MEKKPDFEFEFDFAKDLKKYNPTEYDSFCKNLESQNIDIAKLDRFDGSIEKLHQEFWTKNNKDKPYVDLLDRITTDYSHPNENNTQTEHPKKDNPNPTFSFSSNFQTTFTDDLNTFAPKEGERFSTYLSTKGIDDKNIDPMQVEKLHKEFCKQDGINGDKPYINLEDRISTSYSHPNENKSKGTLTDSKPLAEGKEVFPTQKETVSATENQDSFSKAKADIAALMLSIRTQARSNPNPNESHKPK